MLFLRIDKPYHCKIRQISLGEETITFRGINLFIHGKESLAEYFDYQVICSLH